MGWGSVNSGTGVGSGKAAGRSAVKASGGCSLFREPPIGGRDQTIATIPKRQTIQIAAVPSFCRFMTRPSWTIEDPRAPHRPHYRQISQLEKINSPAKSPSKQRRFAQPSSHNRPLAGVHHPVGGLSREDGTDGGAEVADRFGRRLQEFRIAQSRQTTFCVPMNKLASLVKQPMISMTHFR
jgi:hypothetical protein